MKLLKKFTALLALSLTVVFLLSACSKASQEVVSGESLFKIKDCSSIVFGMYGTPIAEIEEKKDIDYVVAVLSSLKLKEKDIISGIEGGILVTVNTPDGKVEINVGGKNICFDGQWYEADVNVTEKLEAYIER